MSKLDRALNEIDDNLQTSIAKLFDLIAIPSISSEASGARGIAEAAAWLQNELTEIGFTAEIITTQGHPVVLAKSTQNPRGDGLRLLFYGHYDVQPVAPLEDWSHDPFTPRVIEEDGVHRFYGRGASDSKSQLWSFIEALRAWKAAYDSFPAEIVIMLEGEEETGSPSLPDFIERYRDALQCDVAFICDSDMWSPTQPAITTQLKGLVHEKITIKTPNADLHSGHYGAVAANPIRILSTILSAIHDAHGRVTLDGFYDGVQDISQGQRQQWRLIADGAISEGEVSLLGGIIEAGYSPVEAMWGRPTVDINGISGGNQGPGERSVLPGTASARLSFRLVADQNPEAVRESFRKFVTARIPDGCRVEFEGHGGSNAVRLLENNPFLKAAARGLEAEWQEPAVLKGTGGAIPLVGQLSQGLGLDCVVIGFILSSDAIHAPDEHYDVERLRKGTRSWVRIFEEVTKEGHPTD
ncbi:M20/M25/M40 family metallo-hydrolase [Nitratireductor kimnyeongensis]|uniref:M20/M25/M40 family metallo-hydrolase n=1 Tax=Nitratireductor kimnyeongensis TaxID=430679 RepID=A0ABW0T7R7_9HYPH|nr:M20/M25/M40 family metallo-hydrolase [Nitratireductor kimnyeongensis]QZZ34363.1 M20/M25/M40 family metallo-hydrolase [Nitratireductor kimnyeongensis]